ncbi:MAG: energy transducer TonB [Thermoanaerobaculales bacterium]
MIDLVSEELERRAQLALPWKSAVLGALTIHLAVIAMLFLAPRPGHRRYTLPMVQVRLASPPAQPAGATGRPEAKPLAAPAPAPAATAPVHTAKKAVAPPPRHPLPPEKKAAKAAPLAPAPSEAGTRAGSSAPATSPQGEGVTGQRSAGGGIAVGAGNGGNDESFPYSYYLNRLLGLIESNWFRPPDAPTSQCRVLCRLDRSGRLIEAGIEEPSQTPAFDRAALRAVYASSPFPPLPQGYGGGTLTLHLEFGP